MWKTVYLWHLILSRVIPWLLYPWEDLDNLPYFLSFSFLHLYASVYWSSWYLFSKPYSKVFNFSSHESHPIQKKKEKKRKHNMPFLKEIGREFLNSIGDILIHFSFPSMFPRVYTQTGLSVQFWIHTLPICILYIFY